MDFVDKVILGDCEQVLREFPDDLVDLIFTSPPYTDQRKRTYGGARPDEYVDWFLPKGRAIPACPQADRNIHSEHQRESCERGTAHLCH
jgi:DNA modification methylase